VFVAWVFAALDADLAFQSEDQNLLRLHHAFTFVSGAQQIQRLQRLTAVYLGLIRLRECVLHPTFAIA